MNIQEARLALESDLHDIDALLCSAQEPIGLSDNFCASERRPERLKWLNQGLADNLLWVIRDHDGLAGVLILWQDLDKRVVGIAYIVVAERMRGRRVVGPKLVERAKAVAHAGRLEAEARNDNSRRMLEKLGFQWRQECSPSGHQILVWERS
jgi:ribosomal protein S18 acetylase RimI-like enzyme